MTFQTLRLTLDGITAADYLAHVRDPEPPAVGTLLRSVEVRAEPLSDVVEALLSWTGPPAAPATAAALAGLPVTEDVVTLTSHELRSLDNCPYTLAA